MIHIIGTCHSLQVWTGAIRNGESLDARKESVEAFESYLVEVARLLKADMIAEEASGEWVAARGHGAYSVAKGVAREMGIQHLFCDPDTGQRRTIGLKVGEELRTHAMTVSKETGGEWTEVHDAEVKKQFSTREAVWFERLEGCEPNNRSILFVCGADHVDTFKAALDAKKNLAGLAVVSGAQEISKMNAPTNVRMTDYFARVLQSSFGKIISSHFKSLVFGKNH